VVAQNIGEKIGLSDYDLNRLSLLVTLHYIGKINISEEILTKKSSLTEGEWVIVKKHPEIGFRIARATEEFAHIAEDILAHHERWDGSGYPRGLKGKEIPLLARIVAIADAYEVMSNGRPYKRPLSKEEIIAEYKNCWNSF
jgi:HD-GYP domain-containing protein (c-di-GMP phosphodiesterase class II)